MQAFPTSIELSLSEAGFSRTEIIVLRHLTSGQAYTTRELAFRTGKSTGVLDQAMKKLLRKRVAAKQSINGSSRYALSSLEAVRSCLKQDVQEKFKLLQRREADVDQFLASLKTVQNRPDIEYFEGNDGLQKAYARLLDGGTEWLHYIPLQGREEDDPLFSFRSQLCQERRRRKLFARVIAHDGAFGRRYQARDPFTYRRTKLIPKERYPVSFEQVMTGNILACFQHDSNQACLLHYPDFATAQRELFESAWRLSETAQENAAGRHEPLRRSPVRARTLSVQTLVSIFASLYKR